MTAIEQIGRLAVSLGLRLSSAIVPNPLVAGGYLVPITIRRDADAQSPSRLELEKLQEDAAVLGYTVELLLTDENTRQIEEALRTSFLSSFSNIVRNTFLSIENNKAIIWIENKRDITNEEYQRIEHHAKTYISLFALRDAVVHITSNSNLATNTEILSIVRRHAPASCENVRDALLERDFAVPSLEWINRRFDTLRRTGLLIRMPNRTYVLTVDALHRLGSLKNSRSPDVARFLALARLRG
jgi:hypothetical protein